LLAHTPETPETPEIPTLPQPRKRDGLGVPAVSSSASVMYRM
jgi:hypothetical protein